MNYIFKFTGTLCITAYIIGILLNLVNLTHTQKAIRLTAALYIITSIFTPLEKFDFYINYEPESITSEVLSDSSEYIILQASNLICNDIKNILNEKNISYTDVSVHINKQSDILAIEYIEISGVPAYQQQLAADCISTQEKLIFGE